MNQNDFNHISTLFPKALQPAIEAESQRNRKKWIPEFARCRVAFVYRNGNRNYIPSYDSHNYPSKKHGYKGEQDGFYGLLERIILPEREKKNYVSAIICCKLHEDLRTYVDGRIAMDYNFILFKDTLNGEIQFCPFMDFHKESGKLNVEVLKKVNPEWWKKKGK